MIPMKLLAIWRIIAAKKFYVWTEKACAWEDMTTADAAQIIDHLNELSGIANAQGNAVREAQDIINQRK